MTLGGLDGDRIVGLLAIVMALALVSQSAALRRISGRRRLVYGAVWAAIFGLLTAVVVYLGG